nr:hypothetical protein [Neisseria meningitidis]
MPSELPFQTALRPNTQYLPFFSLSIIRYAQITATQAATVPIVGKNRSR